MVYRGNKQYPPTHGSTESLAVKAPSFKSLTLHTHREKPAPLMRALSTPPGDFKTLLFLLIYIYCKHHHQRNCFIYNLIGKKQLNQVFLAYLYLCKFHALVMIGVAILSSKSSKCIKFFFFFCFHLNP